jgi:beta-lactam-binding protein with PASTA domain
MYGINTITTPGNSISSVDYYKLMELRKLNNIDKSKSDSGNNIGDVLKGNFKLNNAENKDQKIDIVFSKMQNNSFYIFSGDYLICNDYDKIIEDNTVPTNEP